MIKNRKIENSTNLYFVEGFDGCYYIISLEPFRNVEAKVPADTFEVIRKSAKQNLAISSALQVINSDRSSEKIVEEIARLHQGGVIILS